MASRGGTARGTSVEGTAPGGHRLREILSLLLLGATLFVALACLSAGRGSNLCGPTGERVAVLLLSTFGYATWLIVLSLGSWGLAMFTRVKLPSAGLRLSGLVLCLVATSALVAHLFGDVPSRWPPGGTVGSMVALQLEAAAGLGPVGTRIVLVVLTLVTFVLATDAAYYASLVAGARWAAQKATTVAEARAEARAAAAVEDELGEVREVATASRVATAPRARPAAVDELPDDALDDVDFDEEDLYEDEEEALEDDEATGDLVDEEPVFADLEDDVDEDEEAEEDAEDLEDGEEEVDDVELAADDADDADDEEELEGEDGDEELEDGEEYEDDGEEELLEDDEEYDDEADEDDGEYVDEVGLDDDLTSDEALEAAARGAPQIREMVDAAAQTPLPFERKAAPASAYIFPSETLLDDQEAVDQVELDALLADKTETLERTLLSFRIEARVVEIQKGPVISMFEMELAPGIKLGRVRALEDDLAIALRARSVRIVAPLPGKNTIGIEVPNPIREMVRLKPLLHCREFDDAKQAIPVFLGRDNAGRPLVMDLARMPHLLVAGATGSGKSVCLNTIISSILFTRTPEQVKLILIDPKMVEMSMFADAPHLASPVVTDMKRAPGILEWAVNKMEERYKLLAKAGVRNIAAYNKLSDERLRARFGESVDAEDFPRKLPFVVIVVDELADLMMVAAKDVETSISRLAAKSRAVGIHIILATQRPSTNVITGLIKANLPTRIAFMVSSKIDSRVIMDSNGAEQLLGQGDMLMLSPTQTGLLRGQCTFMSDEEVGLVMEAVKTESGPIYERDLVQRRSESETDPCELDELYDAAVRFIIGTQRGSASLLQRKFAIGYTRASRLIDLMADEGVLGEYKGSQARDVELTIEEWVEINPELRGSGDEEEEPTAGALGG
jgi:S-DNA-T family DNA segregation ATPase FtsK/SpoIIIE